MPEEAPTRRERYRRATVDEIRAVAWEQVAEGGAAAVSFNAIARKMAMSAPAIYRYFASRDELIAELVVEAHTSLADALEAVPARDRPADRVRAVAHAYRDWALAQPNRYHLIFETSSGSGLVLAPEQVVPASTRSMDVFLGALAGLGSPPADPLPPALEAQVLAWRGRSGHDGMPLPVLYLGLCWWARLHGMISLELGQHLTALGIDPALLYAADVEALLRLFAPAPEKPPADGS